MQQLVLINREDLRCNRRLVLEVIESYMVKISTLFSISFDTKATVRDSIKSTTVRFPANFVPNDFIESIQKHNHVKKYYIDFAISEKYVDVILHDKPLLPKGQIIILYFLRELLQYFSKKLIELENDELRKRREAGLAKRATKIVKAA